MSVENPVEDATVPTCYRHPGRETYVSCTRCERPICPDCMNSAAVGFQCPECVREGSKSVREARTIFGGRVGAQGLVTQILIGLNVLAYVWELTAGTRAVGDYAMNPFLLAKQGEYYRLLTAAFLHANFLHLMLNMLALYSLGSVIERAVGTWRFVALYLAAALGGSTLSYLLSPAYQTAVGASGAVFGLFGAYFVIARRLRLDTSQIAGLIAVNLVFGFVVPRIDWRAHIGGLVVGAAVTWAYAHLPRGEKSVVHVAAVAAVVIACAGVAVTRTDALRDCDLYVTAGEVDLRCGSDPQPLPAGRRGGTPAG